MLVWIPDFQLQIIVCAVFIRHLGDDLSAVQVDEGVTINVERQCVFPSLELALEALEEGTQNQG